MQSIFLGWVQHNTGLDYFARILSIGALMTVRMVVSNMLPFTPLYSFFSIAKSMPLGRGGLGTFYLMLCSMPAGLVIPLFDKILFTIMPKTQPQDLETISVSPIL